MYTDTDTGVGTGHHSVFITGGRFTNYVDLSISLRCFRDTEIIRPGNRETAWRMTPQYVWTSLEIALTPIRTCISVVILFSGELEIRLVPNVFVAF